MNEIVAKIVNHPNAKWMIFELLNQNAPFVYQTLASLNGESDTEVIKTDLQRILYEYLNTQNRLSPSRKHFSEFLTQDETISSCMIYLLNTLYNRYRDKSLYAFIAIYIALERKEEDYRKFYQANQPITHRQALYSFWLLN